MEKNKRYTSVVVATHLPNDLRSQIFRTSLGSLIETTKNLPVEIIVVDNGGDSSVSTWLQYLTLQKQIHCYVYNAENMHFGFARNQGVAMAHGNYICISDNDILFHEGWLEQSLDFLEAHPHDRIYTSFIDYPTGVLREKYHVKMLDEAQLSMRAGSNCWVMRKRDAENLGRFQYHRVAGTKWTDNAVKNGYLCAVLPGKKTQDMALRNGYNLSETIPIIRTLRNGEKVYFNEDEHKHD